MGTKNNQQRYPSINSKTIENAATSNKQLPLTTATPYNKSQQPAANINKPTAAQTTPKRKQRNEHFSHR
jgi:hypothetical protein